jgi:hypothetical protein
MLGSGVLEVAIGVVFVYLLLSLVCTSINEGIASFLNQRGKNLFAGITNLLNDPKFTGLAQQVYTHGLVDGISQEAANPDKPTRLPSYMPSKTFGLVVLDVLSSRGASETCAAALAQRKANLDAANAALAGNPGDANLQAAVRDAQAALDAASKLAEDTANAQASHQAAEQAAALVKGWNDTANLNAASALLENALAQGRVLIAHVPNSVDSIQMAVEKLPPGHTKESLLVLIANARREAALLASGGDAAAHEFELLQRNIEEWFEGAMDRVSGWYKRWTQKILLVIAVLIVFFANADTIMLVKRLSRDDALRSTIVSAAQGTLRQGDGQHPPTQDELFKNVAGLSLPLGWSWSADDRYAYEQVPAFSLNDAGAVGASLGPWVLKLIGLLVTVFAVSLGAPFWFDTLSKFVNVRGAGTPPGEPKRSAPQSAAVVADRSASS